MRLGFAADLADEELQLLAPPLEPSQAWSMVAMASRTSAASTSWIRRPLRWAREILLRSCMNLVPRRVNSGRLTAQEAPTWLTVKPSAA